MENNDQKKVSLVIPVYNAENYLDRCIDSIISQTYKNIEVIFIDDGSKDNSWEILKSYKLRYPDVIYSYHQENMGVSKTRNKGIQLATGDYIMFMDNDDYIDSNYIEVFVSEIRKKDYDLVIGGYRRPNDQGKVIEEVALLDKEYSKYKIVAAWAKIYRLDYIKRNNIEFLDSNIGEDIHFTIQAVALTNKIKIIDYIGYNWYYNEKSVSNTAHKNMENGLQFDLLLNKTYNCIKDKIDKEDEYIEYYFIKLIVWFFLYASRGTQYNIIKINHKKYFDWLESNFLNYKKNKLVKFTKPEGEALDKRVTVKIFMIIHKIHLDKVMLWCYSKL